VQLGEINLEADLACYLRSGHILLLEAGNAGLQGIHNFLRGPCKQYLGLGDCECAVRFRHVILGDGGGDAASYWVVLLPVVGDLEAEVAVWVGKGGGCADPDHGKGERNEQCNEGESGKQVWARHERAPVTKHETDADTLASELGISH